MNFTPEEVTALKELAQSLIQASGLDGYTAQQACIVGVLRGNAPKPVPYNLIGRVLKKDVTTAVYRLKRDHPWAEVHIRTIRGFGYQWIQEEITMRVTGDILAALGACTELIKQFEDFGKAIGG